MTTVLFYFLILVSSTFFVFISEKGKGPLERYVFLFIAFLIVLIPSAIRYDIGVDYLSYVKIYENFGYSTEKEPAFHLINWFFYQFRAQSQFVIAFFAFIFTLAGFLAYPKRNTWVFHLAFFLFLWFFSFNGIRQAIAQSICLIAVFKYFDKKYITFFLLTLLSSGFHLSSLFITTLGAISLLPISYNTKTRIAPLAFIVLIGITFISANLIMAYIEQILTLLGFSEYASYFNGRHFIVRDYGSGLGILVKLGFSIYVLLNTKSLLDTDKQYWLLVLLIFLYGISVILAGDIVIFIRMVMTFSIAPILASYVLYSIPTNQNTHKTVVILFLTIMILGFIKDSFGTENSYSNPKRNPYQTIFSQEYKYR